MGGGVQFDGLAEASWRSETETVASVQRHSGSTVAATAATCTAGWRAGGWDVGARRGRRDRSTVRQRRGGSITVTTSVRIGRGAWGIMVPET